MANGFRKFIESIVYVGMKPAANAPDAARRRLGLFGPLERFLSAAAPADPLYLTNRTFGQRVRRVLLLAIPVAAVAAAVMIAIYVFAPKTPQPAKQLTAAELAAKVLPNFDPGTRLDANRDVQILDVHFETAGASPPVASAMAGNLQNKTDHLIREAVVVFDLMDAGGSALGGITVTENNLAAGSVRKFQRDIEQKTATYALVREVHTQ